MDFAISLTWALVISFIAILIFINGIIKKD